MFISKLLQPPPFPLTCNYKLFSFLTINTIKHSTVICKQPSSEHNFYINNKAYFNDDSFNKVKMNTEQQRSNCFAILDETFINKFDDVVVIGDIHGCNEEFEELLQTVHADKDPDKCLKILVGDLVNKGPQNEQVLMNCCDRYPSSILAVRGNHDEHVLKQRQKIDENLDDQWPQFNWVKDLPKRYIDYLSSLPYTIQIPSLNSIIVHAGLNPFIDKPAENTSKDLMVSMRNIVSKTKECTKCEKTGQAWANFWPGPQIVYFGHDARRRLQDSHKYAFGLDTGCVYGDRLTGIYIKGQKRGNLVTIPAKKVYQPHDN